MNRKQLIFMWIGIVLIVLAGLQETDLLGSSYSLDWGNFILWTFLISLVTCGLIYTFRDNKTAKTKDEQK